MNQQIMRGLLLSASAAALVFAAVSPAMAGDNDPLLQLLQQKGVITAEELARVENGPAAGQRDRLVDLLRAKGVLSNSDTANLSNAPAPSQAVAQSQIQSTGFSMTPEPIQMPARVARADRPPVAHTVTVSDSGSDGSLYYANNTASDTNPLSFKLGGVSFYPGAMISAATVIRSTNTGNSIGTSFGAIPFSNVVQGNASETRITAGGSIFRLKAITDIGPAHVSAYAEADFLGNDAANVSVTSNSHTARLRLAYADATWRGWELLFGQAYGMLTPNRSGLGSDPADIFLSKSIDRNAMPGVTWTRAAQVRVAYHPNDQWALAVALENPDQFVGANEVLFPAAFNAQLGAEFDAASNPGAPNRTPDVTGKIAFDSSPGSDHNFHAELTGLLTTIHTTIVPTVGSDFEKRTVVGGGVGAGINWQVMPKFHFIANGFYSDGGGRYINGLAPDAVVVPFHEGAGFSARPSFVRSAAVTTGVEWGIFPGSELDVYYSGAYAARNAFPDITSVTLPTPIIGFGGTNESGNSSQNRYVQELSTDFIQNIWADPSYGVVQIEAQLAYLQRNPWFVSAGTPVHADLVQSFVELRLLVP